VARHLQPYRNRWIIKVLQDQFFCSGGVPFATQFNNHFATHQGPDGETQKEIPMAMLALVVTAVSPLNLPVYVLLI